MIGGTTADAANVIAYNADRGVVIESGNFNTVRRNSIYDNTGIGVDLNNNHDSLNDPDDANAGAMTSELARAHRPRGRRRRAAGQRIHGRQEQHDLHARLLFQRRHSADVAG
jgi:hypothetical protein